MVLLKWCISVSKRWLGSFQWAQPEGLSVPQYSLATAWPSILLGFDQITQLAVANLHWSLILLFCLFSLCQTCNFPVSESGREEEREEDSARDMQRVDWAHAGFPFIWPTLSHSFLILILFHYFCEINWSFQKEKLPPPPPPSLLLITRAACQAVGDFILFCSILKV